MTPSQQYPFGVLLFVRRSGEGCYNIHMELFNKNFFKLAFGFIAVVLFSVLVITVVRVYKDGRDGHASIGSPVSLDGIYRS